MRIYKKKTNNNKLLSALQDTNLKYRYVLQLVEFLVITFFFNKDSFNKVNIQIESTIFVMRPEDSQFFNLIEPYRVQEIQIRYIN